MKFRRITIISLVFAVFLSVVLSSYREGPAYYAGYDCTGATGSRFGCSGGGCHGATSSNNPVVELDSAGIAVTSYYPGIVYTVKISATNGTGQNLPYFGFQMTSVRISGSGTSTPTQAGTWDSTALPASVHYTPIGTCQVCSGWPIPIVEHDAAIRANSAGTGGNGTVYRDSVTWTAPDSGTGTVILYGALNAVNHDSQQTGDYSQIAQSDTITEAVTSHTNVGISSLSAGDNSVSVYPALISDHLTVSIDMKENAAVSISIYSIQGSVVKTLMAGENLDAGAFKSNYNMSDLTTGIYLVKVQTGNDFVVSKVVKE